MINRLVSAWQQVLKRSLAHWRLLSSVVLGVLLASAIMSGTVIYFDALRNLSLKNTFDQHTESELDILVKGNLGLANSEEYERLAAAATNEINYRVAWMMDGATATSGKTPTFFLTAPGSEDLAGEDNARSYLFFMPDLPDHVTMAEGTMPREGLLSSPGGRGDPLVLEAAISLDVAVVFQVGVGDRLSAVPPWDDVVPYVSVVISGVYERNDTGEDLWYLEQEELQAATGPTFRTAPFYVSQSTFLEALGPSFRRMGGLFAWHLPVDTDRINARNAELTLYHVEQMHSSLASTLSNFHQKTALEAGLREYDRRLFFNKLPMFVVLILIAVVILYYVTTLSSLVVDDRRGEVALLRSRGASSVQILTVFVLEGSTIAVLAVVVGPLLAAAAIAAMGYTPAFADLTQGARLEVTISSGAYVMSAIGGILSFVALIVPAAQASRISVTRHRQEEARPASQPAFQRYYVDVLLLVLSIFLFRQLTEQGSVVATRLFGGQAVNQLLLALPGFVLVASAMVLLRLFPLAMNLASRTMSPWLSAGPVLGVWQMARNPTHYARLSLLLILTAGLGIFASSFGATLELSFEERVLYATGSDIRVDGVRPSFNPRPFSPTRSRRNRPTPTATPPPDERPTMIEAYEAVPGVERGSPVLASSGHDLSKTFGESYSLIAMDSESFNQVAWFRRDFADKPMSELLDSLKAVDLPEGITLPADASSIGLRLRPDRPHPTVRVTARIKDAKDRYSTYFFGTLRSSDWSVVEASLSIPRLSLLRQPDLPLELVSLRIHELGGDADIGRRLQAGSILIDDIWVGTTGGERVVIEAFEDASGWRVLDASAEAVSDLLREADGGFDDGKGVMFSWSQGNALTAHGIYPGSSPTTVPVLASKSFVERTGHSPGDEFKVSVAGFRIPVRLEETLNLFPTMTSLDEKLLVADLTSITRYANLGAIDRELLANGVWLSVADNEVERAEMMQALEVVPRFSSRVIHDRAQRLARSQVDPLVEAGWRALLFIAFGAVLILSCLGFLVHAYVSFRNRQLEFALLRTVGFSIRQLTVMVWLEQMLVIGTGLALGTWMGGRLGEIIMPFLGHDDWGDQVIPPFVMKVNWGALLITYAIMAVVFAGITLALIWLIHRISLQRTLRLGEM